MSRVLQSVLRGEIDVERRRRKELFLKCLSIKGDHISLVTCHVIVKLQSDESNFTDFLKKTLKYNKAKKMGTLQKEKRNKGIWNKYSQKKTAT